MALRNVNEAADRGSLRSEPLNPQSQVEGRPPILGSSDANHQIAEQLGRTSLACLLPSPLLVLVVLPANIRAGHLLGRLDAADGEQAGPDRGV